MVLFVVVLLRLKAAPLLQPTADNHRKQHANDCYAVTTTSGAQKLVPSTAAYRIEQKER